MIMRAHITVKNGMPAMINPEPKALTTAVGSSVAGSNEDTGVRSNETQFPGQVVTDPETVRGKSQAAT